MRAETGSQKMKVRSVFNIASNEFLVCPWNSIPLQGDNTNADDASGCASVAFRPPGPSWGAYYTWDIDVTQAMVDNGGFAFVMKRHDTRITAVAAWVPLYRLVVGQSGALSLEEGESGTYTVKLNAQPRLRACPQWVGRSGSLNQRVSSIARDLADPLPDLPVKIVVASNNAGVAVKEGQELTFTRANWNTAQTVTVEALSDDNSLDERAVVSHGVVIGSTSEYSWIAGDKAANVNVNVMDDDYPGLMITGAEALESEETLDFTVKMSMASTRPVEVDWTLVTGSDAGTATPGTAAGGDYDSSVASGTLVFYEGSPRTRTISFPINDDRLSEGDETVKVSLSVRSPSQVRISGSSVATGTIVDDDERTVVGATSEPVRLFLNSLKTKGVLLQ